MAMAMTSAMQPDTRILVTLAKTIRLVGWNVLHMCVTQQTLSRVT